MDKTIKRFGSLDEMKAASIREWQRLPASERFKAVMELTLEGYAMKGLVKDVPRLQRTLVRVKRPPG
jgi:hypothetical protein